MAYLAANERDIRPIRRSGSAPVGPSAPHPGSVWLRDRDREELKGLHDKWVAADGEGVVAVGETLKDLQAELDSRRPGASLTQFAVAFVDTPPDHVRPPCRRARRILTPESWLEAHWTAALAKKHENQWIAVSCEGVVASGNSRRVLEEELKMNCPGSAMTEFVTVFVHPN